MRKCHLCLHYEKYSMKIMKNLQEKFHFNTTEGTKWRSRKKGEVEVEVTGERCNYYHEQIHNDDRARSCPHYQLKAQQTDLTTFIEGDSDVRLFFERNK